MPRAKPKIDPGAALAAWNEGRTLKQIRAALNPDTSLMGVWRAIHRAVKRGLGVKRPYVPDHSGRGA